MVAIVTTQTLPTLDQSFTPQIERIPLYKLHVDHGYQRTIKQHRIRKIIKNFDWLNFDPLFVSIRVDGPDSGKHFVVDGQHRYVAAKEVHGDLQEVPALIVPLTYEEEAKRFAQQDENKLRVSSQDLFRARLESGDADALILKMMVERNGFAIGLFNGPKGKRTITAVSTLNSIYTGYSPQILERTLQIVGEAWGHLPECSDAKILSGMAHFLYHFPIVDDDHLIDKLMRPEAHPRRIVQNSAIYGNANATSNKGGGAVSRAIFDQYNFRMSRNRLEWDLKKYR